MENLKRDNGDIVIYIRDQENVANIYVIRCFEVTVLVTLLPFLYAILYSSKKVTRYVYILTVISTVIIVYGG